MKREELEKWVAVLKEKNPLGMPSTIFNMLLQEQDEFKADLQIAKFIDRLLPNEYEEALKIYKTVLTEENIERVLKDRNENGLEEIIEEIVWGYMNAAIIFASKKDDLPKALKYINKSKDFMNCHPIDMAYISKGEVYYTRWKLLEKFGKVEEVLSEINELLK
ncbi:MAG: hypothetical protein H9893_09410 [Candidatus Niameybacter stercoravium]|nr:hypothetical protein [Candidatus Niameybacter stercoravium]